MKIATSLATVLVLSLTSAPVEAGKYRRVEKIAYVGSAVPSPTGGFHCSGSAPPGPGMGCVFVDRWDEKYVSVAIDDAISPDVSAWMGQVHWDGEHNTNWVFHRFCNSTEKPIKLLPETNRIFVTTWQGTCPGTLGSTAKPAFATSGEVTITLTR